MVRPREGPKCTLACTYCRVKKAKCSGETPCKNCVDHRQDCWYPEAQRRSRKRKHLGDDLDERLQRLEALWTASQVPRPFRGSVAPSSDSRRSQPQYAGLENDLNFDYDLASVAPQTSSLGHLSMDRPLQATASFPDGPSPHFTADLVPYVTAPSGRREFDAATFSRPLYHPTQPPIGHNPPGIPINSRPSMSSDDPQPRTQNGPLPRADAARAASVQSHQQPLVSPSPQSAATCPAALGDDGDDVAAGNSASAFICSEQTASWISTEMGFPDIISIARRHRSDVMRNESLDHGVGYQREPEPDPETARKWIAAYFDESLESIYGVIHRPQFEARIRRHFASSLNDDDNDPAWYALRNAVYATGCRYVLSDPQQPQSFLAARSQSWKYYENALSVHTDLLYTKTNLTSIQALIIMAFFAEALGSPTLEFILVLNATRLAQLKAMHLEVSKSWNLSEESTMDRYWLWWTLYAYEKHLAFRSGHPSTIDDEDISCPLPQSTKSENPVKAEFCLGIIKHSQLCSQVQKRLWTVKALRQSPKETVAVVEDLQRQLEKWHQSLPAGFRQAAPFKNLELPPDFHFYHGIYYHFAYNAVQIAINTALCYPWVRAGHRDLADSNIQRQQRLCLVRVAEASRSIITATQRLDVNATSPVSITFYYPLMGLMNLFICVLKNPTLPSVISDISLMDVVVGHFGYLEYVSASSLVFPFPREIVAYARNLVQRAKGNLTKNQKTDLSLHQRNQASGSQDSDRVISNFRLPDLPPWASVDLDSEDWTSYLPSFAAVPPITSKMPTSTDNADSAWHQLMEMA